MKVPKAPEGFPNQTFANTYGPQFFHNKIKNNSLVSSLQETHHGKRNIIIESALNMGYLRLLELKKHDSYFL